MLVVYGVASRNAIDSKQLSRSSVNEIRPAELKPSNTQSSDFSFGSACPAADRILEIKRAFEDENVIKIPIIQRYELAKEQLRLYQKELS